MHSSAAPANDNVSLVGNTTPCLQAFYGARKGRKKKSTALALVPVTGGKLATVKALISPGERPQEIYTPACVIEALLRVWPHIALDPCSGPRSIVGALDTFYVPGRVDGNGKLQFQAAGDEQDGLSEPWVDYTYVNPPYSILKVWMDKARFEGTRTGRNVEVAMLAPTRGHRTWFRDACASATSVIDLDPVKFVGFKSTFPAPLCMIYWGSTKSLFELAFEALGDAR